MATVTLRGIDEALFSALKEKARREDTSVNALMLKIIKESLGIEKKKRTSGRFRPGNGNMGIPPAFPPSSTPVPFTAPECPSAKPDLTSFDPTSFFAPPVDAYCKCTSCSQLSISNIASNVPLGCPYATAERGACHMSGDDIATQNRRAMIDSIGQCLFPTFEPALEEPMLALLSAITGRDYDKAAFEKTGERIFNLEKMFNYREGFRRADDRLPARFFEDAFTIGAKKGAVLYRSKFEEMLTRYHKDRGWDPETTKPGKAKLQELGLYSI